MVQNASPVNTPVATSGLSVTQIAQCGLVIALLAVAAQVTVAIGPVPFTLQLLVVVLAALVFTPGQAALALCGYVLLGAVGLPVFSGMGGGIAKILGVTGGYIYGFILSAFLGALVRRLVCNPATCSGRVRRIAGDVLCAVVTVAVCYLVGTLHFMAVSAAAGTSVDAAYVLGVCVVPFIVPDVLKSAAAILVAVALRNALPQIARN